MAAKPSSQDTGEQQLSLGEKGSVTRGSGVGKEGTRNLTFLSRVGYGDLGERTVVKTLALSWLLLVFPGFPSVGSRASGV